MFERQHQYSSLFGTFEADQRKICELQCNNDLALPPSCLLDSKKNLKILCGHCPPHVYPHTTWCHAHDSFSQGLPPQFLHTASDQKLEAGTAWKWGYTGLWIGLWTKIWSGVQFHVDCFLVRISLPRLEPCSLCILKPAQTLCKCYLLLVVVASWLTSSYLSLRELTEQEIICISMWSIPLHERCKPLALNAAILTDLWGLSCIDFCELKWTRPNR